MSPKLATVRPMTEAQLQAAVEQLARTLGWRVCHHRFSIGTEPGWPDVVALRDGRCVIAELKSEKGELSVAQCDWLLAWEQIPGAEVFLWKPSDLDEIVKVLR